MRSFRRRRGQAPLAALVALLLASLAGADTPGSIKPVSLGLGSYNYYSSGPFADTVATGMQWLEFGTDFGTGVFLQEEDGTPNPQFDARGLPRFLAPGRRLRLLVWPYAATTAGIPASWPRRDAQGAGLWTITWRGDADVRLAGATFVAAGSSGAATGRLVDGRRVYRVAASQPAGNLVVEAINPDNPLSDLRAWLPDPADPQNRSLEGSASRWHPDFLATLASLDFGHLRFMDWGKTNQSPVRDWSDRRLPSHVLQEGVLRRRAPAAGFAGNRPTGMAYELMVELCNATGKDLWICVPHLATDDFVTRLARLIRFGSDGVEPYDAPQAAPAYPPLAPGLRVWVEYSNEIWSSGNAFPQGNWAQDQANALGITKAAFNARRTAETWSLFQRVFGGSERLVRCAALWTARADYSSPYLAELARYGPTLDPPAVPDIAAPTTYFGNGIQDWAHERATLAAGGDDPWFHAPGTFVADANTGATRPLSVPISDPYWASPRLDRHLEATFTEWKRRIFSGSSAAGGGPDSTGVGGGFSASLAAEVAAAAGRPLPLVAYEGGPSLYVDYLDGVDVRDDGVTHFLSALNRAPGFEEIYRIQLEIARSKGLVSHSIFVDTSLWGKFGQWGHLEYPGQPTTASPKWRAVTAWADAVARLRPVDAPVGGRPTFPGTGTLEGGSCLRPFAAELAAEGGDGPTELTVIGDVLVPGLRVVADPGTPGRVRIEGTPRAGGWNHVFLRATDRDGDAAWRVFGLHVPGGPGTLLEVVPGNAFGGAAALPWSPTRVLDPAVSWSGIRRGAPYAPGGGSATGTDGTGVNVFVSTDGLVFSVSQGTDNPALSTLASALADNEYLAFTIHPAPGRPLDLRRAAVQVAWKRDEFHSPRRLAVMTSVDGFSAGDAVYVSGNVPPPGSPTTTEFLLPDDAAYGALVDPVEIRLVFHGGQYTPTARLVGLRLARAAGAAVPYSSWAGILDWQGLDAAPGADPDHDGMANLLEHALGLSPFEDDSAAAEPRAVLDVASPAEGWVGLEFRQSRQASEVELEVESSPDLVAWTNLQGLPGTVDETVDPDVDRDGATLLRRVRAPVDPASPAPRFLRLRARTVAP